MDSFVSTHTSSRYEGALGINTMGYYEKGDLPFYYDLAKKFTICDNYFCSVLGPTHPNRLMQLTGTLDPAGVAGGPILVTRHRNRDQYRARARGRPCLRCCRPRRISWKCYNPYGSLYQPGSQLFINKNVLLVLPPVRVRSDVTALQERLQLLRSQRHRRPDRHQS